MTATVNRVIGRKYEIGSRVYCSECQCGQLTNVVVDPETHQLEHLIVVPGHGTDARLVPASVAHPEGDAVRLHCTLEEFRAMEPASDAHLIPVDPDGAQRDLHDEHPGWPFFELGPSAPRLGLAAPEPVLMPRVTSDYHVPPGEARLDPVHVHATDGFIGHFRGVVVPPDGDAVTHLLLDEGHLWGHKCVAIPVGTIDKVDENGVSLRLTKHEIKELAPCEVVASRAA